MTDFEKGAEATAEWPADKSLPALVLWLIEVAEARNTNPRAQTVAFKIMRGCWRNWADDARTALALIPVPPPGSESREARLEKALEEVAALEESLLLGRIEAQCARALAGDHDRKSLMAALTFAIDGIQDARAIVRTAASLARPSPSSEKQGKT